MTPQDKLKEITEYAMDRIEDLYNHDPSSLRDIHDLHHEIFNTDYYIVGRYQATKWLGQDVFDCIEEIKSYEMLHFGEVYTDFSDPERVANMYVYIVGEEILQNVIDQFLENQASS